MLFRTVVQLYVDGGWGRDYDKEKLCIGMVRSIGLPSGLTQIAQATARYNRVSLIHSRLIVDS